MVVELKSMSRKELTKLRRDVDRALAALDREEKRKAKKAAEKAAAKFGFSLNEIVGDGSRTKRKSTRSAPASKGVAKYANPDDPKQTWTGKGRQPNWFKQAVEAGKTPESMEI